MRLGACFWKMLEASRGYVSLRCLGTGGRVASCRRSALMCLGKARRRDQGGMQQEMPQVELPWKSHAESKGLGGTITQLPVGTKPCPATTVTPFSCLLHAGAAEGAARNTVPARPQSPSPNSPGRPSAQPCMWLRCSLLAPSGSSYSL